MGNRWRAIRRKALTPNASATSLDRRESFPAHRHGRLRAGLVTPHTDLATEVFCAMAPDAAARITHEARAGLPDDGDVPAYEAWRQRIADEFAPLGCRK